MLCREKPVVGYDGYTVTESGRVFSYKSGERREMKLSFAKAGYPVVNLTYRENGLVKQRVRVVHRMVLEAFIGVCPQGAECRHLNGNPKNNNLSNLRWGTPRENQRDKLRHGTDNRGERNGQSKLTEALVLEIRERRRCGEPLKSLVKAFGVTDVTVSQIATGQRWRHLSVV